MIRKNSIEAMNKRIAAGFTRGSYFQRLQEVSKFNSEADDYNLRLLRQSDAAWCVRTDDDDLDSDVWLPKSQCEMHPPNAQVGSTPTFTVPNWLAEEKGLI